jgi:2-aminoadipate transaminase
MASVKLDSGTNPYAAHLAAEWAGAGKVDPHVALLRGIYKARRDAMLESLGEHCAGLCSWTRPEGGFFIWVHLEPEVDPVRLREAAHAAGVLFLPGSACFASGRGEDYLRLAFSLQEPERIREGIARLGAAMRSSVRVA